MTDQIGIAAQIHEFMRTQYEMSSDALVQLNDFATTTLPGSNRTYADFCLRCACTYSNVAAAKILISEHEADLSQGDTLFSDRHPGHEVRNNLLDETLGSYINRPDIDDSLSGKERLAATVELLLQNGVSASLNDDPLETAIACASIIANPARAYDPKSPEYNYLLDAFKTSSDPKPGFQKPYELIRQYQPEAIEAYETAIKSNRGTVKSFIESISKFFTTAPA